MEVELKRILLGALLVGVAARAGAADFGVAVDALLARNAPALFGIEAPLAHSAAASPMQGYRVAGRSAADSIALADGLVAEFLTTEAASHSDMMAFYPATAPSHLISCIESDAETLEPGKMQPGVQRISLADGKVETIVRGTAHCDGIRTTPWGTILFTEERDYISIATTRPETMLGDGAVAVHPEDERYAPIVGKLCEIPVGPKEHRRLIPIITDD